MKKRAVILVIGKDKVGIVYNVSKVLYECNINIEDITQKVFDDSVFTMIMFVDLSEASVSISELREKLQTISREIGVKIEVHHEDLYYSMHRI